MPKFAFGQVSSASMDAATDLTTIILDTDFFDTGGEQVITERGAVSVVFDPTALLSSIHSKMVDAIVAYALDTLGWTVPRTSVIHTQVAKGLII